MAVSFYVVDRTITIETELEVVVVRLRGLILAAVVAAVGSAAGTDAATATAATGQRGVQRLIARATLKASNTSGRLSFGDVAISGSTIVADSFTIQAPPFPLEGAYVFTQPRRGWANEAPAAHLVATTGDATGPVAISGNDAFVVGSAADGSEVVFVFTRPADGWSGDVRESARLVPSPALGPMAVAGAAIAASNGTVVASGGGAAYVFTKPAGGWSGTIGQAATLKASDGLLLRSVALSGSSVFAGESGAFPSDDAVYAFRRPAGGWAGTIHQSARLSGGSAEVASSGSTVISAGEGANAGDQQVLYVFSEPKRGWVGAIAPRAQLSLAAAYDTLGPDLAISGQILTAVSIEPQEHECPCGITPYAQEEPSGGWSGFPVLTPARTPSSALQFTVEDAPDAIAIDRRTLIVGADDGVHVFQVAAAPRVDALSLRGLAIGRARLSLKVAAGSALRLLAPP